MTVTSGEQSIYVLYPSKSSNDEKKNFLQVLQQIRPDLFSIFLLSLNLKDQKQLYLTILFFLVHLLWTIFSKTHSECIFTAAGW